MLTLLWAVKLSDGLCSVLQGDFTYADHCEASIRRSFCALHLHAHEFQAASPWLNDTNLKVRKHSVMADEHTGPGKTWSPF